MTLWFFIHLESFKTVHLDLQIIAFIKVDDYTYPFRTCFAHYILYTLSFKQLAIVLVS